MNNFRVLHVPAKFFTAAAIAFLSSPAQALCTSTAECGHGFSCEVVGGTACAGVACPDNGQPCPAPPPCEPQVIRDCMPAACAADADCAGGMVCHSETVKSCLGTDRPACAPNEVCPAPAPETLDACTTSVVSQCMPRYLLGCSIAADCGDGFDCVAVQECSCSGSAGTGSSGGMGAGGSASSGFAAPPPGVPVDPTCTCTSGPNKACQVKDLGCTTDANCPATWTCSSEGDSTTCSGGAPKSDPSPDPNGGAALPAPECTTVPGKLRCLPPFYGSFGLGVADSGNPGTKGPMASGEAVGTSAPPSNGVAATPSPFPNAPDTAPKSATDGSSTPDNVDVNSVGGCQIGMLPGSTSGFSLVALVGLTSLLLRRRPRQS